MIATTPLLGINVAGLLGLIWICWLIWNSPPQPKMLVIPVSNIIATRVAEVTPNGTMAKYWDDHLCRDTLAGIDGLRGLPEELVVVTVWRRSQ